MSQEFAMLLVLEGNTQRSRWELRRSEIIIGRGEDCDIVVDDRQVSRQHTKITQKNNQYHLIDLGSKNGTYVNNEQMAIDQTHLLMDGDQIGIALSTKFVFVDAGATTPLVVENATQPEVKMALTAKRVWVMGKEINPPLSLAQYKLLELLYTQQGGVVSRDEIVATVWAGEGAEGVSEQAIDALARRLRERIAEIDDQTQYVITVRGHGFRLEHFFVED